MFRVVKLWKAQKKVELPTFRSESRRAFVIAAKEMNSLLEPEEDESEPLWTQGNDEDDHDEAGSSADSLYAILNLDKSCSQEDIQRAYKRLAGPYLGNDPCWYPIAERPRRLDQKCCCIPTGTVIQSSNQRPIRASRPSTGPTASSQTRDSALYMMHSAKKASRPTCKSAKS